MQHELPDRAEQRQRRPAGTVHRDDQARPEPRQGTARTQERPPLERRHAHDDLGQPQQHAVPGLDEREDRREARRSTSSATEAWLEGAFIKDVQERGKAIIEARGKSSAMSAAGAAVDHAAALYSRVGRGRPRVSLCVLSDGSYGVPEGIVSSFPCTTDGAGNYAIVQGIELDDYARGLIKKSTDELLEERSAVSHLVG